MIDPAPAGMSIRRATPSDAALVRDLTRSAYAKWVPAIGREPLPMRVDYERAVREHMIDLLVVDDEVAALIETVNEGDHLLIENVAVAPSSQGNGYGSRLMVHAEQLAHALRLPELRLYTNRQFAENVAFYGRRGYVVDREEPFMGGFTVYMRKPLARD